MKLQAIRVEATTYGLGPFHPAFRRDNGWVSYWPNITYPTEEEAYNRACEALGSAFAEGIRQMANWNVLPATKLRQGP